VRSILDDRAALYLWLSAIPVGVFAMYALNDFRMFIIAWAAAGLSAAVLADVGARRGG
jgi:methyl coenzyme M reductase beta subunit